MKRECVKIPVWNAISKGKYRRNCVFVSIFIEEANKEISKGGTVNLVISPKISSIPSTNNMNYVRRNFFFLSLKILLEIKEECFEMVRSFKNDIFLKES